MITKKRTVKLKGCLPHLYPCYFINFTCSQTSLCIFTCSQTSLCT